MSMSPGPRDCPELLPSSLLASIVRTPQGRGRNEFPISSVCKEIYQSRDVSFWGVHALVSPRAMSSCSMSTRHSDEMAWNKMGQREATIFSRTQMQRWIEGFVRERHLSWGRITLDCTISSTRPKIFQSSGWDKSRLKVQNQSKSLQRLQHSSHIDFQNQNILFR